jgi:hypothetical protein
MGMRPAFILASAVLFAFPCLAEAAEAVPRPPGGIMVPIPPRMPAVGASGLPRVMVPAQPMAAPAQQCRQAIRMAERAAAIPEHLMAAIARVESGRVDAQGVVHPWPWTINAEGVGHYYETKAEAIAAVRTLQARGVKSIDVGCMQVNLMFHPDAFASLEVAFDPAANARYAASFLRRLNDQTGNWTKATAAYHSATPELGNAYERRVSAALPDERVKQSAIPAGGTGNLWSANAWTQNAWNTGGGGQMLNNRADGARILPMVAPNGARGLDAYRASPIPVASIMPRPARIPPG